MGVVSITSKLEANLKAAESSLLEVRNTRSHLSQHGLFKFSTMLRGRESSLEASCKSLRARIAEFKPKQR